MEGVILSEAYFTITSYRIETSLITTSICDECVKHLICSYNFKILCENTEKLILENTDLLADKTLKDVENFEVLGIIIDGPLVNEYIAAENSVTELKIKPNECMEIDAENVFNCKECGRNYRSLNSLRRHAKDHHCRTRCLKINA